MAGVAKHYSADEMLHIRSLKELIILKIVFTICDVHNYINQSWSIEYM